VGGPCRPRVLCANLQIPFRLRGEYAVVLLPRDLRRSQGVMPVHHLPNCPSTSPPSRPAPVGSRQEVLADHVGDHAGGNSFRFTARSFERWWHRSDLRLDPREHVPDEVVDEPIPRITGHPLDGSPSDLRDLLCAEPTRVGLDSQSPINLLVDPEPAPLAIVHVRQIRAPLGQPGGVVAVAIDPGAVPLTLQPVQIHLDVAQWPSLLSQAPLDEPTPGLLSVPCRVQQRRHCVGAQVLGHLDKLLAS